jgi:hypothetical protein
VPSQDANLDDSMIRPRGALCVIPSNASACRVEGRGDPVKCRATRRRRVCWALGCLYPSRFFTSPSLPSSSLHRHRQGRYLHHLSRYQSHVPLMFSPSLTHRPLSPHPEIIFLGRPALDFELICPPWRRNPRFTFLAVLSLNV